MKFNLLSSRHIIRLFPIIKCTIKGVADKFYFYPQDFLFHTYVFFPLPYQAGSSGSLALLQKFLNLVMNKKSLFLWNFQWYIAAARVGIKVLYIDGIMLGEISGIGLMLCQTEGVLEFSDHQN